MDYESYEQLLLSYCRYQDVVFVKTTLARYDTLDLKYNEGMCFKLAIEHQNHEILSALLDYYKTHNLLKYDIDSAEYKQSYNDLCKILYSISPHKMLMLSEQIEALLEQYIEIYYSDDTDNNDHYDLAEYGLEDFYDSDICGVNSSQVVDL